MNKLFEEINEKIKQYDTIIIHRHKRPDGDCIGSSLGLREILKDTFPEKHVYCAKDIIPNYLTFLGSEDEFDIKSYDNSLVIIVDTATSDRISSSNYNKGKEIIKIDHHPSDDNYGDINLVCEEYGSCSLVIAEMCMELGYKISPIAARYLYTATVTDTGRFRFASVDGKAMKIAGELLDKGINIEDVYTNLYSKEKEEYKLEGYVYNHMKFTENGVCYMYLTKHIRNKFNVSVEEASSCVNMFENIKGSMIWVLFIQYDNEIRVRLRSRYINIRDIAEKFNGGGHDNACGATIHSKSEIKQLLALADKSLKEYKKNNEEKF